MPFFVKEFEAGLKAYSKTAEFQALQGLKSERVKVLDAMLVSCDAIAKTSSMKRPTALKRAAEVLTKVNPADFKPAEVKPNEDDDAEFKRLVDACDVKMLDKDKFTDALLTAVMAGVLSADVVGYAVKHLADDAVLSETDWRMKLATRKGLLASDVSKQTAPGAIWSVLGSDKTIDVTSVSEQLYNYWYKQLDKEQKYFDVVAAREKLSDEAKNTLYLGHEPTSLDELKEALRAGAMQWEVDHGTTKTVTDEDGNQKEQVKRADIAKRPDGIADVLMSVLHFAALYDDDPAKHGLYWYDLTTGLYSANYDKLKGLMAYVQGIKQVAIVNKNTKKYIIESISEAAGLDPRVPIKQSFEAVSRRDHGHWLACANGVLDMTEPGSPLRPFGPDMYVTSKLATAWTGWEEHEEPTFGSDGFTWKWSDSLTQIAGRDTAKRNLLEQISKAAIIGASWLRRGAILFDRNVGSTGKSTYIKALEETVGENAVAKLSLADMSKASVLVHLVGKSLVTNGEATEESGTAVRYRTDVLKKIMSCESVLIHKYYENPFPFTPHCFVLQAANDIPDFGRNSAALLKRFVFVEFTIPHDFSDPRAQAVFDTYIRDKKLHEWLLWHVVAQVELGATLTATTESNAVAGEVEEAGDPLVAFSEQVLPEIASDIVPVAYLYSAYKTYFTTHQGEGKPVSRTAFARQIKATPTFNKYFKYQTSGRITPWPDAYTVDPNKPTEPSLFIKVSRQDECDMPHGFIYEDTYLLTDAFKSTRWGAHLDVYFPLSQGDEINPADFVRKLKSERGSVAVMTHDTPARKRIDYARKRWFMYHAVFDISRDEQTDKLMDMALNRCGGDVAQASTMLSTQLSKTAYHIKTR